MKKLLLPVFLVLLLLTFTSVVKAQETVTIPKDVAETALKAVEQLPYYQAENKLLKDKIAELERQRVTPCSIAMTTSRDTIDHYAELYNNSNDQTRKTYKKLLESKSKEASQIVKIQCNLPDRKSALNYVISGLERYGPIVALVLLNR